MNRLEADRFVIQKEIGKGGFSVVYLARDKKHLRDVAVKACPLEAYGPESEKARLDRYFKIDRLRREAEIGGLLGNHPNVVKFYDSGELDYQGRRYLAIVQEHLEGRTLAQITRKLRDSPDAKTEWPRYKILTHFLRAVEGTAHAHENGVIHRDEKPENIMYVRDYTRARLFDFGIAKLFSEDTRTKGILDVTSSLAANLTEAGTILATPAYMSPEQAEGKQLDARTDVWSLGIVLCESCTLRRPFEGDTSAAIYDAMIRGEPQINERLHKNADPVPQNLGHIIRKCLSSKREDRYPSARELAEDLDAYIHSPRGALELLPSAKRRRYTSGEIIAREGEPSRSMYVLEEGKGNVFIDVGKRSKMYTKGFFGEAALVKPDQPRSATIRAGDGGCELVEIPDAESFATLIQESPQLAIDVIKAMHIRLINLEKRYEGPKAGDRGGRNA